METKFNAAFFKANRERLTTLFAGTAPIVLAGNGLLQRNNDTTYPFRQDSNFWYLTGIDEPDIILVMDKGKEYLVVPERSDTRTAFDGSVEVETLIRQSGVEEVLTATAGWKLLGSRLKRVKHVATQAAPKSYIDSHGMYTNPARRRLVADLKKYNPELELLDLRPHLTKMRSIKQSLELEAIQQAIDLSCQTFNKIRRNHFGRYQYEYEIEADITSEFRKAQAGHAYQPIIASGRHACTLHYTANTSSLARKDVLLIDAGAEVCNYAADITRSYVLSEPNKRQRAVHQAVLEVQKTAFLLLKPGVMMRDYEQSIEQLMGEKLRELGLIKSISKETVRQFYPHSTSHFLGLDVHDIGDYEAPLTAGMVLTVEPGIYIHKEKLGIRIEDDVLITDEGNLVLSAKLPHDLY